MCKIEWLLCPVCKNKTRIKLRPDMVLAENGNGIVKVQLEAGANYIGITGVDYAGTIQITVE